MNIVTARNIAKDAIHRNIVERIGLLVEARDLLADSGNRADLFTVEMIDIHFPHLDSYDSKGNWIGSVSNENGWTP